MHYSSRPTEKKKKVIDPAVVIEFSLGTISSLGTSCVNLHVVRSAKKKIIIVESQNYFVPITSKIMSAARFPFTSVVVSGLCGLLLVSGQQQLQSSISKTTEVLTNVLLKSTTPGERFNHVTAPFAGSMILALAAEGADTETKSQLTSVMGGQHPDKDSYKNVLTSIKGYLSDGNARNRVVFKNFVYVYKNYSVLDSFAELARDYYLADVRSVARPSLEVMRAASGVAESDSEAADDELSSDAGFNQHAMLIFNGFSLEMNWPISTWHRTSLSWNGNVVRAFGAAGNFVVGEIPSLNCTAFVLPYKNTDYAMLVLMPKNKENSLDDVLGELAETGLENITKTMSMKPAFVTMPCFQSSNITHMKTLLQDRTEVKTLFTDSADLSKLSSDKLYLDDVVQQAGIRVCVDGTSSHSLSSSAFTSQRVIKESVVADRPFVYAVYNVANNIIYSAGKLERPDWDETDGGDDLIADIETIKM